MPAGNEFLPERYHDPRLIAHGGMGDVYCAVDTVLGRPVAIKLLALRYAADAEIRKRFTREALAAARLSGDPNIVTIYDVGESDGRPFIVMEYVPDGSLDDVLRREGAQPPARALPWLEEAARALDRAHERGIVHRDVKPANLLLDTQGHVHVADFGVASAAGLDSFTQTGTVLGTAGYLSPEQAQGRPTTAATDSYALGVVAFELLTGSRPYQDGSVAAEAAAHVQAPVPAASQRGHGIPPSVDAVFRRALEKHPSQRFGSCAELVAALRAAYAAADQTTRITRPAGSPSRRSLLPLLLALAAVAVAGGVAAALLTGDGHRGAHATRITITEGGTTVRETITAQAPTLVAPPTVTPPTTTTSPSSTAPSGSALALEGYQRLQAHDAAGALPLLRAAAQQLQGTGSLAEAYNDYNLAFALTQTQGCSAQVLQLLAASQAIQGHRSQITHLRNACRKSVG